MAGPLEMRLATFADVPEIVRMLADDDLGKTREDYRLPLPGCYEEAFDLIQKDPNVELVVAVQAGQVVGTLQLIYIPSLSYQGGLRAQVESVRVEAGLRSQGIGTKMMNWAMERSRLRGARLLQLTTDQSRKAAHRFYERLGFKASHLGMKIKLKQ